MEKANLHIRRVHICACACIYRHRFRVLNSRGAGEARETERVGSETETRDLEGEKRSVEERERDLEAIGGAPTNSEAIEREEQRRR